ncbi:MAG: hypothetical protein V7605_318 [Acidimicrobiaceae bacterium]
MVTDLALPADTGDRPAPPPPDAPGPTLRYRAPLDGLRALAVMAVLAYHGDLVWARGGFIGVDVFFVLSGFLITGLILVDHQSYGRVRLGRFWRRRALRLLPALIVVLVGVSVAVPLLAPDQNWRLGDDLLAALAYVSNWRLIYQHQSYFQAIGRPPVLQHLWSLAVEEQFYLVWPVVVAVALRAGITRRRMVRLIVVAAVGSAALMAALYRPADDPSRVYYGTDTRAAALLVGAAVAFLWNWGGAGRTAGGHDTDAGAESAPPAAPRRGRAVAVRALLEAAGVAALVGLGLCVRGLDQLRPGLYRGGFLGVAMLAAVVVAVGAAERRTLVGRVLGWRPLVWLGRRSYGVYLWFWPVFMLTRPHADIDLTGYPLFALRASVTVALATASYRFVEMPIRSGALARTWSALRSRSGRREASRATAWTMAVALAFAAIAAGVVVHRRTPTPDAFLVEGRLALRQVPADRTVEPGSATTTTSQDPTTTVAPPEPTPAPTPPAPADTAPAPTAPAPAPAHTAVVAATGPHGRVTAIGESVLMEAEPELAAAVDDLTLEAAVGRQMEGTIKAVQALHDAGGLGDEIIVQVGNNGTVTSDEFEQLMSLLSGARRVAVVNVKVPRVWEESNNDVLASGVARWPNAVLLDWHSLGSANPDVFLDDGVHLRPDGVRLYTQLILSGL